MEVMYTFVKAVKKANQTRRYSIQTTASGWEVREEEGTEITRQRWYDDWHRVERARHSMALKLDILREEGWRDA
jgi:hypothetical protein